MAANLEPVIKSTTDALINTLVERRTLGLKGPSLKLPSLLCNLTSAFELQSAMSATWCQTHQDSVAGWKCLLPSAEKQVVAPIFASEVYDLSSLNLDVPPIAVWTNTGTARIEPELVFVFNKPLLAAQSNISNDDIDAAIGSVHLGLELIGGRFELPAECSFYELFADGLFNQGLVIGPAIDISQQGPVSELTIALQCGEQPPQIISGQHQNNNAKAPLYWLVNFLHQKGISIQSGDSIITGSYAGVLDVPLGEKISISYQGLGALTVTFCQK
ncbi:fumarylacetoacetate hydrolase family protein [Pseudoalteromonas tunicata]|uniref:fumarylacetoacetate hydrolase family protein n=1 Tax=Pseudoalteromonas tunicata TaxID=314281 RepID=UPI00273F2451|nr:fumarylacetoacetate hydrolase family protein [Pseudoalteromonas tunicata]MDP4983610.1 fumarylacetoacetate hydrolase family protein [Pseudoalteromonas tunicata]